MMAPLYKRPIDLLIVIVFVQFLFIAITIGKLCMHSFLKTYSLGVMFLIRRFHPVKLWGDFGNGGY